MLVLNIDSNKYFEPTVQFIKYFLQKVNFY
jgi:hypothetical protein